MIVLILQNCMYIYVVYCAYNVCLHTMYFYSNDDNIVIRHKVGSGHLFEEQIEEDLNNNLDKLNEYNYGSPTVKSRRISKIAKQKTHKTISYSKIKSQIDKWELTEVGEEIKQRYVAKMPQKMIKEFFTLNAKTLVDLYRSRKCTVVAGYKVNLCFIFLH